MKELSIEQKAKAYDEAVKRIENINTGKCKTTFMFTTGLFEYIFPELAESEDEKVRKVIYNCVKWFGFDSCFFNNVSKEECLAWLEKQGEQKFEQKFFINDKVVHKATGKIWTIHHYLKDTNSYYVEDNDGLLHHYRESELKLVEQKPILDVEIPFGTDSELVEEAITIPDGCYAIIENNKVILRKGEKKSSWSEEDSPYYDDICEILMNILHSEIHNYNKDAIKKDLDWFKSLKDRLQPKQEWSEKDIAMSNFIALILKKHQSDEDFSTFETTFKDCIDWLKSLRPQSQWKPSKEQVKVLEFFIPYVTECSVVLQKSKDTLSSLLTDLKKLREG